jgi:TPR repeat protein
LKILIAIALVSLALFALISVGTMTGLIPRATSDKNKAPVTPLVAAKAVAGQSQSPNRAQEMSIANCDALAAHPDDPEKEDMQGVTDEDLQGEKAILACQEAVKISPAVARLQFQLGRGYWKTERYEEAVEAFVEAGKNGHGGALAYLGDATLYGVAGLGPDPELARDLYQNAAKAGFKPARAVAAEIVAGAKPVATRAGVR